MNKKEEILNLYKSYERRYLLAKSYINESIHKSRLEKALKVAIYNRTAMLDLCNNPFFRLLNGDGYLFSFINKSLPRIPGFISLIEGGIATKPILTELPEVGKDNRARLPKLDTLYNKDVKL